MSLRGILNAEIPAAAIRYKVVRKGPRGYMPLSKNKDWDGCDVGGGWAAPDCPVLANARQGGAKRQYECGVHCYVNYDDARWAAIHVSDTVPDVTIVRVEARGPIVTGWQLMCWRELAVDVWKEVRIVDEIVFYWER